MRPARWTIRARLTIWYLTVLALATVVLAAGSWWLMRRSLVDAADSHLRARIDGVVRLITGMAREHGPAGMQDEFHEYADLTVGDGWLEVSVPDQIVLCRPAFPDWDELRARIPPAVADGPPQVASGTGGRLPFRIVAARRRIGGNTYDIVAALPMGPAAEALRLFGWTIAGLAPAVLIVAGLGGYWISRRALAPVDQMTRDVQAMTLRRLDRRIDVPAAEDEVRRLANTFNDLLARLEAGVADMARFTADAAHELRTPVTLVRTTADVALSRERAEPDRQALAEVLAHAEQMSDIVSELLLLARADAGVEPRATDTVDLGAAAAEAARVVSAEAARRGLVVDADVPARPIVVTGDAASLRRLLLLLLDNAVKYTPAGGRIRVRVAAADGTAGRPAATLDVIDSGPGVDPAERARVFDRFYRGASARQRVAEGTGLGLSIAKAIVARHRGTIAILDGDAGAGCRVSVVLPVLPDEPRAGAAADMG